MRIVQLVVGDGVSPILRVAATERAAPGARQVAIAVEAGQLAETGSAQHGRRIGFEAVGIRRHCEC